MSAGYSNLWIVAAAVFVGGATVAVAPNRTLAEMAGRYTFRFKNGNIDGDSYQSTDVVEIFPLRGRKALVQLDLNFFNGHSCFVRGVARLEGQKLVYREKSELSDEPECTLRIWKGGSKLKWEDDGTCRSHCGSRGGLSKGSMALSSRRPLKRAPSQPLP